MTRRYTWILGYFGTLFTASDIPYITTRNNLRDRSIPSSSNLSITRDRGRAVRGRSKSTWIIVLESHLCLTNLAFVCHSVEMTEWY